MAMWLRRTRKHKRSPVAHLVSSGSRNPIDDNTCSFIQCYSGTDLIFPFSENWPANYNFSLFSKLPANYQKNQKIFKKQSKIRGTPVFSEKIGLIAEYCFIFWIICW